MRLVPKRKPMRAEKHLQLMIAYCACAMGCVMLTMGSCRNTLWRSPQRHLLYDGAHYFLSRYEANEDSERRIADVTWTGKEWLCGGVVGPIHQRVEIAVTLTNVADELPEGVDVQAPALRNPLLDAYAIARSDNLLIEHPLPDSRHYEVDGTLSVGNLVLRAHHTSWKALALVLAMLGLGIWAGVCLHRVRHTPRCASSASVPSGPNAWRAGMTSRASSPRRARSAVRACASGRGIGEALRIV